MFKVGIDLDDTINNLVEVWIDRYNKDYNDNVKIEDIKTWDIGDHTKAGKDFYKYLGDGETFKNLSIKDGAAEVIEKLCEQHEVYIVTANASYNKGVCDDKVNFIKKFMPFFPIKNIIFISNKSLLDLDILIDDGLRNFEGFKGHKIVFDRPWNQVFEGWDSRIFGWNKYTLMIIEEDLEWIRRKKQIDLMAVNAN